MTKYEFLIRLSMINGKKLSKLKKYPINWHEQLNPKMLLEQCNFTPEQQQQFFSVDKQIVTTSLKWLEDPNHHLIDYFHEYYPPLLKQISAAPLSLFVKGDPELLSSPQIAMVGSRQFSEYGAHWARHFAAELAINGMTITSGLALGIDAICHRGALDVSGKTIAVLGSGLKHITPSTNHRLAKDILEQHGAIISEFLPEEPAKAQHFPRRNRIISGLSLGTLIVEASKQSGSLITARYALEHNRDVFALPGEIGGLNSSGTHWLIQQGAYLVTSPVDILMHLNHGLSWISNIEQFSETKATEKQNQAMSLHPEVFTLIRYNPVPADNIADKLSLPISDVMIKLLELELAGMIKTVTGGYVRSGGDF